ncbi:hypothetical protein [Sphingobacterium mizutaii]|uniref:hypothetical protein n=1 Tax=Sphingobacterium mizutaii TaxID=1010 RepID=UPI00162AD970|nr:hypothetical protein [Sphingobacterium mizutaii]
MGNLLKLQKMDLNDADAFLTKLGWEIGRIDDGGKTSMTFVQYAKKNPETGNIKQVLNYIYDKSENEVKDTRVSTMVYNRAEFESYLNTIKSYGCKLVDVHNTQNNAGKEITVKVYRGKTTSFLTSHSVYGYSMMVIEIMDNFAYDVIYAK